jgi:uncharacterized protein YjdB
MKKAVAFFCLIRICLIQYGQIIDHTCTNLQDIPAYYINQAKENLHIVYEHTSHGSQIIDGMTGLYSWKGETYKWNNGGYDNALDIHDHGITGGSDLGSPDWTSWASSTRSYLMNTSNSNVNVVMWSWCSQVSTATQDNINTYLSLMSSLERDFPHVRFVYMTGHLDGTGVNGTLHTRNEQIRNYCRNNNKLLYDFADIESYDPDNNYFLNKRANDNCDYDSNNDGSLDRNWAISWQNSHTLNIDWYYCSSAHSQPLNANRKAYAAWWLFARIAGWNGLPPAIKVSRISVSGYNGSSSITSDNGTLQLTANILPSDATNKTVAWSLSNGTGQAIISSSGLVTAVTNGTVTAKATATDGSGTSGTLTITISNQIIPVSEITVKSENGINTIGVNKGSQQLLANVLPLNATNKGVIWSVINVSGQATISQTGLLTAVSSGTVTAKATATDGSGIFGTLVITILNQFIPVNAVSVTSTGNESSITSNRGTLQLIANILPSNATNQTVTWSISNLTGEASINSSGLVTAEKDGLVLATATTKDGSGISGTFSISIFNQLVPVEEIIVNTESGSNIIPEIKSSLQLRAQVTPSIATYKTVNWSVKNVTGRAIISPSGLVTAVDEGIVSVTATATDGTGVNGTIEIEIKSNKDKSIIAFLSGNEIKIPLDGLYSGSKLNLYDINGCLISSKPVTDTVCMFDTSNLKPGIYIILLSSPSFIRVGKFIFPG